MCHVSSVKWLKGFCPLWLEWGMGFVFERCLSCRNLWHGWLIVGELSHMVESEDFQVLCLWVQWSTFPTTSVKVTFLIVEIKSLTKQLEEGRKAHRLRVQSVMAAGKWDSCSCGVHSQEAEMNVHTQPALSFWCSLEPPRVPAHTLINTIKKIPHGCDQRFISKTFSILSSWQSTSSQPSRDYGRWILGSKIQLDYTSLGFPLNLSSSLDGLACVQTFPEKLFSQGFL